jgi:predicted component of type VI protein secretion system
VVIGVPWVSQHHGLIHFDEAHVDYVDLGSTNGTKAMVGGVEETLIPRERHRLLTEGSVTAELRIAASKIFITRVREQEVAAGGPLSAVESPPLSGGRRNLNTRLTSGQFQAVTGPLDTPLEDPAATPLPPPPLAPPARAPTPAPRPETGMTRQQPEVPPRSALSAASPPSNPLLDALAALAVGPAGPPLRFEGREREFVELLAAVVDAFARGLTELKRGLKDFGNELGVRTVGGHSPLHQSQSAAQLLRYLLEPTAGTRDRLEQLVDLFADMMIHDVALLNGIKEGVRDLIGHLDPEGGYQDNLPEKGGKGLRLFDKSLRQYTEYFRSVVEDDGEALVFGEEFARAYTDATGARPGIPRKRS